MKGHELFWKLHEMAKERFDNDYHEDSDEYEIAKEALEKCEEVIRWGGDVLDQLTDGLES